MTKLKFCYIFVVKNKPIYSSKVLTNLIFKNNIVINFMNDKTNKSSRNLYHNITNPKPKTALKTTKINKKEK